jgi:hypothetical protein
MRTEYHVVLNHVGNRITVFSSGEGPSAWDPSGEIWGVARTYEVVTDSFTKTQELVPLGEGVQVSTRVMKQRFPKEFELDAQKA